MNDDGLQEAAILMLSLGEEEASEVFKHLSPREVQKLGETMAKLPNVSQERIDAVLEKFDTAAGAQTSLSGDAPGFVRGALTRALGEEKANYVLEGILQSNDMSGIESLKWMDAASVAELVRGEHPQIIASILVHLERDHAAGILSQFNDRLRNDVVLRVATLDGIQPSALKELNQSLGRVLTGGDATKKSALGGVRPAAEMMNFLGGTVESTVIEAVREHDADLAQKILDEMFVFDNVMDLDDKAIQLVLREAQSESLVVALKGTSDELQERIFSNMSQRAAEMLRDDLESKGPVRLSEVEAEQKEILKIVRRLAEEGQIALGAKGDEAFV